ncbi:MAG: ATP-binding protein, partial [Gammaproteobacteria bacterium]|nr:ATP-binding protein [Gammaproteobacteria bacterium]
MSLEKELSPQALYHACDPEQFDFELSSELSDISEIIGQARALDSLHFGIGMKKEGYNLFVLGPNGMGKHTMVHDYLERQAQSMSVPDDWCYVNNFQHQHKPTTIALPAGKGAEFRQDMDQLLEDLLVSIPRAFETEVYREKVKEIESRYEKEREAAILALDKEAEEKQVRLMRSPSGFVLTAVRDGKPINAKEFDALPQSEREKVQQTIDELEGKLNNFLQLVNQTMRETRKKIKELNEEVAIFAAGHLIDALKDKYKYYEKIIQFLDDMQEDVVEHLDEFQNPHSKRNILGMVVDEGVEKKRYKVNLLVDNSQLEGAPVIYEDNPMYHNLVGRIEHVSQIGTLVTDFTLIKAGSLHQANGGYLILDARKLLTQPYAWEGLKRALAAKEIRIQSLAELFSLISTVSLQAEPIPLDIKIVLIGDRLLYYLLMEYDPEFLELFKVAADFEEDIARNDENMMLYARMIATLERKEELLSFDRSAVARIIEYSSRKADDAGKLTTHMLSIIDLMREADYWAREA